MPIWFPWAWASLHQHKEEKMPKHKEEKMPKIKKKYKGRVCCQHCGILNNTLKKLNSKYYFCISCINSITH